MGVRAGPPDDSRRRSCRLLDTPPFRYAWFLSGERVVRCAMLQLPVDAVPYFVEPLFEDQRQMEGIRCWRRMFRRGGREE